MPSDFTSKQRVTIGLTSAQERRLDELSKEQEMSKSDVIKEALALYSALSKNMDGDDRLQIASSDGNVIKELVTHLQ